MTPATLPAIQVEDEFLSELEAVLTEGETLSAFVEQAVRGAMRYRRTQAQFLARAEQAWRDYRRTGRSLPADEVFERIQKRIEARRLMLRINP